MTILFYPGRRRNYFQKLENLVSVVRVGNLRKADAQEFASSLHDDVGGSFKIDRMEGNFQYGRRSVEEILGNWFERAAYRLNKKEATSHLKTALAKAEKYATAFEIDKVSGLGE